MNEDILFFLNQYNGTSLLSELFLDVIFQNMFKTVPFMLLFWAAWFSESKLNDQITKREKLTTALFLTLPLMLVTRGFANYLPFSLRPIHTPGLDLVLLDWQTTDTLEGWSSFPSDHAALYFGFAVSMFIADRRLGSFAIFWALFCVCLPRIVSGYHWPIDILGGLVIGGVVVFVLFRPIENVIRKFQIVPYFEDRESIGYPLLFLATYEVTTMFEFSRFLIEAAVN